MVKMPTGLLGVTFIFWAWQLDFLWLGIFSGLLLEGARLFPAWRPLPARFVRIALRLCQLVLLGLGLSLATAIGSEEGLAPHLLRCVAWLPAGLLPLMLALAWSGQAALNAADFRLRPGNPPGASSPIHPEWPVWAGCILAAASQPEAHSDTPWFFVGLGGLLAWAIAAQPCGERRHAILHRGALALAMLGLGFVLQLGLHALHGTVQEHFGEWFLGEDSDAATDPGHIDTAIGHSGTLGFPRHIVMRVHSDIPLNTPLLLREASFTTYVGPDWLTHQGGFATVEKDAGGIGWSFPASPADRQHQLHIRRTREPGHRLLPLPAGTTRITLLAGRLERNRLGSVMPHDGPATFNYTVTYSDQGNFIDAPPDAADLQVPARLQPALAALTRQLHLNGLPARQAMSALHDYFPANFRYSLKAAGPAPGTDPLLEFLQHTHAGHCEYFATATVLLLRQAGIPARYATGYAVQEYSPAEQAYVVRANHAHAWAQVYTEGHWQNLDTTPSTWLDAEEARTIPYMQGLLDGLDRWWFHCQEWLEASHALQIPVSLPWQWISLLPLLWLSWRLWQRRQKARGSRPASGAAKLDDAWDAFEAAMQRAGLGRHASESARQWALRLHDELKSETLATLLVSSVELHYRERFDPREVDTDARQTLRNQLETLTQSIPTLRH